MEVLFHLPTLDEELFKVIVTCCQGSHVSVSVVKYILQVLHFRFVKFDDTPVKQKKNE